MDESLQVVQFPHVSDEIVDWIYLNKRGKAFKDYTWTQIADSLLFSVRHGAVFGVVNAHLQLVGICTVSCKDQSLHVTSLLTTAPGAIRALLKRAASQFPSKQLTGLRNGKLKAYGENTANN